MAGILAFARFLPLIISGLALASLPLLWNARSDYLEQINGLEKQIIVRDQVIEQEQAAKAVLNAHIKRLEKDDARKDAILTDLRKMPGRDVPLSDLLRATVERLR